MYKNRLAAWIWPSGCSLTAPDVLHVNKLRLVRSEAREGLPSRRNSLHKCPVTVYVHEKVQTNRADLWYQSKELIIDMPGKVGQEYGEPQMLE